MKTKRQRADEIMASIRAVLWNDWDPIGVRGFCSDNSEYDSYIGGIYRLLAQNVSEDEMVEHLFRLETREIGTGLKEKEHLRLVARKLLALDVLLNK